MKEATVLVCWCLCGTTTHKAPNKKQKKPASRALRAMNQSSFSARARKKKSAHASRKHSLTQRQWQAFKNNTTHSAHGHVDTDTVPTGVCSCTRPPEERPMARGREARLTTKLCSCRCNTHRHTHTWSGLGQNPLRDKHDAAVIHIPSGETHVVVFVAATLRSVPTRHPNKPSILVTQPLSRILSHGFSPCS